MATSPPRTVDPKLDSYVKDTLLSLKEDFFASLQEDADSTAHSNAWMEFSDLVVSSHDKLAEETLSLVYNFSLTREIIDTAFSELHSSCKSTFDQFSSDISQILSDGVEELSLEESLASSIGDAAPPITYIALASQWLLDNIHNPYPSVEVRNSISNQTGARRKDIDGWFTDARKKIGWNSIRKHRFSNRRADVVEAATQFFKQMSGAPMDPIIENEFVEIQWRAQEIRSKFEESTLAVELDKAVKDLTPHLQQNLVAERQRKGSLELSRKQPRRPEYAYPSPERSPTSYSCTSLPSPTSSVIDLTTSERSACKRKRSTPDEEQYELYQDTKASKRYRIQAATPHDTGLPSPSPSVAIDLDDASAATSRASSPATPSDRKRKRTSSDSEPPRKRLHGSSDIQTCHPDPEDNVDGWLQNLIESCTTQPEPVSTAPLDSSEPLDIDIFNFSAEPMLLPPQVPPSGSVVSPCLDAPRLNDGAPEVDKTYDFFSGFSDFSNYDLGNWFPIHSTALPAQDSTEWSNFNAFDLTTIPEIPELTQSPSSALSPPVFDGLWNIPQPPQAGFLSPGISPETIAYPVTMEHCVAQAGNDGKMSRSYKRQQLLELQAKMRILEAELGSIP